MGCLSALFGYRSYVGTCEDDRYAADLNSAVAITAALLLTLPLLISLPEKNWTWAPALITSAIQQYIMISKHYQRMCLQTDYCYVPWWRNMALLHLNRNGGIITCRCKTVWTHGCFFQNAQEAISKIIIAIINTHPSNIRGQPSFLNCIRIQLHEVLHHCRWSQWRSSRQQSYQGITQTWSAGRYPLLGRR